MCYLAVRHRTGPAGQRIQRIFAQFADGTQLGLPIVAQAEIEERRSGGGAPDFILLYQAPSPPGPRKPPARTPAASSAQASQPPAAYTVTGEQVREWAFLGWCALIDADKYLRRGSLWEAHSQLHEARQHIWAPWAAAHGALYHDPGNLPPGIEHTVAGLNAADLHSAARASAGVLATASQAAARRHPADVPTAMATYVTRALAREP